VSEPSHSSLQGTLAQTAADITARGAHAHVFPTDLRDGRSFTDGLKRAVEAMDGVDVLINNASALETGRQLDPKRMDLLHQVNVRATLLAIQELRSALEESEGSIVTMSPAIKLGRLDWIADRPAYTVSKYAMTLATLGAATTRVQSNCLWPFKTVATEATRRLESHLPGAFTKGRSPVVVAEAAWRIVHNREWNARCLLDDDVLGADAPKDDAPKDLFVEDTEMVLRSLRTG